MPLLFLKWHFSYFVSLNLYIPSHPCFSAPEQEQKLPASVLVITCYNTNYELNIRTIYVKEER